MRGKTPVFTVELLNNFSVSFQVSPPFTYGPGVQPIAMTNLDPLPGTLAVVSGWGTLTEGGPIPTQLQAVEVNIISRTACKSAYAANGGITGNMICTGVPEGGKDACKGDSGGPLVVGGQLAGMVSWGVSCALADYPRVYSNLATLRYWVTSATGVQ
jgi:trypsin